MKQAPPPALSEFFTVRVQSVTPDRPLHYDLFVIVNNEPVLFRKQKDSISKDRMDSLLSRNLKYFYVPKEQEALYRASLREMTRDPDVKTEVKGKFIKESAFVHVNDLFTKEDVKEAVKESEVLVSDMVDFISTDINSIVTLMRLSSHDYYTYNHSVNVGVYSIALAQRTLGDDKNLLIMAGLGGLLHDIGKRKIPLDIINKPGKLTKEEWEIIKKHPDYGYEYVSKLESIPTDSQLAVVQHHENYDGTGYPKGLSGDEINQLAKITTIADVFDAMTTKRSYSPAIAAQEALKTMYGMQPGKFDPTLFSKFNKNFDKKSKMKFEEDFDPCTASHSKKFRFTG